MNYIKKNTQVLAAILLLFISTPIFSQNLSKKDNATISLESKKNESATARDTYNNFSAKKDTVSFKNISKLINQLENLEIVSGTVYFSGAGGFLML